VRNVATISSTRAHAHPVHGDAIRAVATRFRVSFQAVIVPSNFGVTAAAPPSAWTPTSQDVTMAEGGVQRCMAARCEKNERPLSRYVRQYYGQYRDQRKMLLVRFIDLASFPGLDWRRRAIVIFDAPISFMELLYDTQTGDCQEG